MNNRRLRWVVAILAGLLLAGVWLVDRMGRRGPARSEARAAPPTTASQPATRPAKPALAPPPSRPAVRPPASAVAPAPPRPEWPRDDAGLGTTNKFVLGSVDPNSGYRFQLELVRQGAAVNTVKLAHHFATVADKRLYESLDKDHQAYVAACAAAPGKYKGHYSLLNPVGPYRAYATRSISVRVADGSSPATTIRLDDFAWRHVGTEPTTQPAEGQEIRFAAMFYRDANHGRAGAEADYRPALRLVKTYRVFKNDYSLEMRLRLENLSGGALHVYVDQYGPTGVPPEDSSGRGDDRFLPYGRQDPAEKKVTVPQYDQGKIMAKDDGVYELASDVREPLAKVDDTSPVVWVGHCNKFFGSMMYVRPDPDQADRLAPTARQKVDYHFLPTRETRTSRTFVAGVRVGGSRQKGAAYEHTPGLLLPATGEPQEMVFAVFAGPKKRDMFANPDAPRSKPLYQKLNYLGTISLKSCFCGWDTLTLGMMWLLQKISRYITFGNYGVAIMILVFLVRVVLHPLTKKGQVHMVKMQKIQPEMAKLRKKYADDKETLQKEMMKFYKQQGATPLLGCLPMLLQMPIWISLWGSLNAAVELRHAAFLPVWIIDLAGPDALVSWGGDFKLPLLGGMMGPITSLNLLPILMTAAMFFQMKFNPQMSQRSAAPSPEQETQKKMMQLMMPAMMLLFLYNAASGLTLYIMTSVSAGVLEQWVIRKHIQAKEAAEAAAVTTVKVPGKAARGQRPKKPKGPFWIKRG